jgi:hypothetical protein
MFMTDSYFRDDSIDPVFTLTLNSFHQNDSHKNTLKTVCLTVRSSFCD